jgi:hypothetical protein
MLFRSAPGGEFTPGSHFYRRITPRYIFCTHRNNFSLVSIRTLEEWFNAKTDTKMSWHPHFKQILSHSYRVTEIWYQIVANFRPRLRRAQLVQSTHLKIKVDIQNSDSSHSHTIDISWVDDSVSGTSALVPGIALTSLLALRIHFFLLKGH